MVRPKASIPKLRGDQSTLTQLDWVSTPGSSKDDTEVIAISSDEDYEQERPTKRRRKSKQGRKEQRQSTLTQILDRPRPRKAPVDEDGFEIWQDEFQDERHRNETVANIARRQESKQQHMPWLRCSASENEENEAEIPESSQLGVPSSSKIDSGVGTGAMEPIRILRTPIKGRILEVPSTQTPPSTVSSARHHLEHKAEQTSPLKERSANIQRRGDHQRPSDVHKRVQHGTQKVPLNDTGSNAPARRKVNSLSPTCSPDRTPKGLERMNTVPDSQPEDEDLYTPQKPRQHMRTTRTYKRTATVQDSQFDEDEGLTQALTRDEIVSQHQPSYPGYTQATYDPIYSALSRDAARFRWTQTQRGQGAVNGECEDSETDDEDLDRGCGIIDIEDFDNDDSRIPEPLPVVSQAGHHVERLYTSAENAKQQENREVNDDLASDDGPREDHDKGSAETIPSSPPCPRSSPDSVTVSKAASLGAYSKCECDVVNGSLPHTYRSQASTIVPYSSPSQIADRFHDAHQGSAIPLPPWSSSCDELPRACAESSKSEITDWSLPPPPPMSSSKAATPASSSRR